MHSKNLPSTSGKCRGFRCRRLTLFHGPAAAAVPASFSPAYSCRITSACANTTPHVNIISAIHRHNANPNDHLNFLNVLYITQQVSACNRVSAAPKRQRTMIPSLHVIRPAQTQMANPVRQKSMMFELEKIGLSLLSFSGPADSGSIYSMALILKSFSARRQPGRFITQRREKQRTTKQNQTKSN
jgi:hypothetical protein